MPHTTPPHSTPPSHPCPPGPQNRYRSPLHHCFVPPPALPDLVPVLAARGQSCDDACGALPANASAPAGRAPATRRSSSSGGTARAEVLLAPGVAPSLARRVTAHSGAAATRSLLALSPPAPPSARPRPFTQGAAPHVRVRPPSRLRGDAPSVPAAAVPPPEVGSAAPSGPVIPSGRGSGPALVCEPRFFGEVNTCAALTAGLPCASCGASQGADQPALVSPDAPSRANPMACLRTTNPSLLGCAGSHPDTHRLCPCRSPLVSA